MAPNKLRSSLSCTEATSHGPKIPSLLLAEARSTRHGPKALVAEGRRVRCAAVGLRVETSWWPPSPCAEDRKRWAIFATGTWAEGGRSRSACRINEDHESDLVCRSQVADVHCELKMDRSPRRASQSCCARLRAVPKRTSLSLRCACRRRRRSSWVVSKAVEARLPRAEDVEMAWGSSSEDVEVAWGPSSCGSKV